MSAASARRRKQKLLREKALASSSNGSPSSSSPDEGNTDIVLLRLQNLLEESATAASANSAHAESVAYEALQLAQSQVRKCAKASDGGKAFSIASGVTIQLLNHGGHVGMASQLSVQMLDALLETHTQVTDERIDKLLEMDSAYRTALSAKEPAASGNEEAEMELDRLRRLHLQFLRKCIRWSDDLGPLRYGDPKLHALLGHCAWTTEDRSEAILHYALAEQPQKIPELLMTLPSKAEEWAKERQDAPKQPLSTKAAERDALLTRAILVFLAVENLRDANLCLQSFIKLDTNRNPEELAKAYMAKGEGRNPTHVTFCCSLIRVCETEAAPLYSWLIRSFQRELGLYQDLQPYTTKIGRVYFGIQPPPSMLSMMENMMGMMGGGGLAGMAGAQGLAGM